MIETWSADKRDELLTGNIEKTVDKALVWVSQLPSCIEKQFKSLTKWLPETTQLRVAYQKPASLRALLFNPRALENAPEGGCEPCGKCKMCGGHGKIRGQNMVKTVSKITTKNLTLPIKTKLNCRSSGIYVAICNICEETYTGQTSTSFSKRFNNHRQKWIEGPVSNRDDTALLDHYREHHSFSLSGWKNDPQMGFDKAFKLVFVDKVGSNLAKQEDYWKMRLKSSINRCTIITPTIT